MTMWWWQRNVGLLAISWFASVSVVSVVVPVSAAVEQQNCERLKATLTYTQEKAPRDLSSVLPLVVEKVNRVLDGVIDVEVEWTGAELHGRVGEHLIQTVVTRLAPSATATATAASSGHPGAVMTDEEGRSVTTQCFHVPFTILDTNECTLPKGHALYHKCSAPSICVNTMGSYQCLCPELSSEQGGGGGTTTTTTTTIPGTTADDAFWKQLETAQQQRSPWEVSFASESQSSCPASASTQECCPESAHSTEGRKCRQRFHCPIDPCVLASTSTSTSTRSSSSSSSSSSNNECASTAQCVRADRPTERPNYTCLCPQGLMGNGRACQKGDPKPEPKVMFDGKTPTELTLKNNYYCGCTKPVVDACSGFPPCKDKHQMCTVGAGNKPTCACKPGYVDQAEYGCVDQNPPTLKLRHDPSGDKTLRLKQGQEYREYMVDIVDDNAEDYLRSLKVSYSQPLPPGCLTQVGEFHVNYTVAMPWANVPYVRETRRVMIDDIDECSLPNVQDMQRSCPALVPQCDTAAGAKCMNTFGSYQCTCPTQSSGDGFRKTATFHDFPAPESYQGGTSCVDTSKPIITLQGPNPKVFKICECGGLTGVMSPGKNDDNDDDEDKALQNGQRKLYEADIQEMVRASAGAELCALPGSPNPKPSDCVNAVDHTYQGDIDLSDRVVVGEPQQQSAFQWLVPYNVKDDAGNEAATVWREVVVQEVDLASVESLIRAEVTREAEVEKERAVQKAVREEKTKWEREQVNSKRQSSASRTCPVCPQCDCPNTPQTTKANCQAYCEDVSKSCSLSDESFVYSLLFWMEDYVSPSIVPVAVVVSLLFLLGVVLRFVLTAVFNPRGYQSQHYASYGTTTNDDMILRSPHPVSTANPAPPRQSMSTPANGLSFLSPERHPLGSPPAYPATNGTPQNHHRSAGAAYDESIYMSSPPLITPSKMGDGARRRNLYDT